MIFNKDKIKSVINDITSSKSKEEKKFYEARENESNNASKIFVFPISNSDSAYLCSLAAKTCYNLNVGDTYKKNINHIERVMGYGHDSISAHSNIIGLIEIDYKSIDSVNAISIINAIPGLRFMNFSIIPYIKRSKVDVIKEFGISGISMTDKDIKEYQSYNRTFLVMSGSIRAYRYFLMRYKELKEHMTSPIDKSFIDKIIRNLIFPNIEKEFFTDLIKDDSYGLKELDFNYRPDFGGTDLTTDSDGNVTSDLSKAKVEHQKIYSDEHVDLIYKDNLFDIFKSINSFINYNSNTDITFDALYKACLECGIVTIRLKNYSRAISQQINRHLSGISQESQRYVDYSNTQFIDPLPFNPKVYPDPNKKYHIKLQDKDFNMTSKELGQMLISIYSQLKEQGMVNQEARSFLPMNSETKTIHTFTYKNLFHFIHLRASSAAQPEVQEIANEIRSLLIEAIENEWNSNTITSDYGNYEFNVVDKIISDLEHL